MKFKCNYFKKVLALFLYQNNKLKEIETVCKQSHAIINSKK